MTKNRRAKQDARSRMERTGERYTAARRATLNPDTTPFPDGRAFVDDACANCMGPLPDEEDGLFCSPWCRETTKHVRYFRRVFRDGRIHDPDVQAAVRTRLAFLPGGGYDAMSRNLSPQTREAVKTRARGICQECGKPGTDVDHIAGSSPELDNLQLLCKSCHREKTDQNLVPAPPQIRALIDQLMSDRVSPATPRLLADDEIAWASKWRELKTARRQRLLEELVELGIDPRDLKTRAEMVLERDDAITDLSGEEPEFDEYGAVFDPDTAGDFDGGYGPNSYFACAMSRND